MKCSNLFRRCTGNILGAGYWLICVFLTVHAAPSANAQSLEDAYRTELMRLTAEQDSMRTALSNAKALGARSRATLTAEIESLSRTLTRLRADNNNQEMQLPQTARLQSLQEQERNVDRRARQIETWLETHGISFPAAQLGAHAIEHTHPALDIMMKAALDHVEEHGQLWVRSNQEYFDIDGVAQVGAVLRIAEVGALVVEGFRPLTLASDGSLRVTEQVNAPAEVNGATRSVGVVLFDPDDIRPSTVEATTWRDWMNKGGVVMWVIGALAVLALLLFLERIFAFSRYYVRLASARRKGLGVQIPKGDRLLKALAVIQTGTGSLDDLETQAAEAILQTQPFIRRGVSLLAVVASVAPLLGLLGTVTGMIGTFGMITEYGTGDPRLLSGGISEALLTTQFGLMVAIPALLFQTTLYRCGDAILRGIEHFALAAIQAKAPHDQASDLVAEPVSAVRSA